MRKLYFISHRDMKKNRADCVHIMRICTEYVRNGFVVTLVTPKTIRLEYRKKMGEIWEIQGVEKSFKVIELPVFLFDNLPGYLLFYSYFMRLVNFSFYYLYLFIFRKISNDDVFYASDHVSVFPVLIFKKIGLFKNKIFVDKGEAINDWLRRYVAHRVDGLIAINNYIFETIIKNYNINPDKVYKRKFPSMLDDFKKINLFDKKRLRRELNIDEKIKIITYSGKISPEMIEIKLILDAAKILNNKDYWFYFVGIRDISKPFFNNYLKENKLTKVRFIDFQPINSFIKYVKAADILVSYYDGNDHYSANQRVPAKSSLYLVSHNPSIFADVPSLREWFTDDMVYFVTPNRPNELAEKIEYIFKHPIEAQEKAKNSYEFAEKNTYESSYKGVCDFIYSKL